MLVSSSPTRSEHSRGHQTDRSGSVGDDVAVSGQLNLDTSPMQIDRVSHQQADAQPATARRGHTHRRSGAISSHDLSAVLRPSTEAKGGSAPITPSDTIFQHTPPPQLDRSISQPIATSSTQGSTMQSMHYDITGANENPRSRVVGFSDHLEYIPRPLSTVSSETSSSMSTIRANHSVTNSITSIVSGNTSSPSPANPARFRPGPLLEQDQIKFRPNTAGAPGLPLSEIWEWNSSETERSVERPFTAPADNSQPQTGESLHVGTGQKSFSTAEQPRIDPFSASKILNSASNTTSTTSEAVALRQLRRRHSPSLGSPTRRPRTSPEPKVTKRQKKRKSWADLLSRKARPERGNELISRRTPTPPQRKPSPEPELSLDDIDFDNDTTLILETTSPNLTRTPEIQADDSVSKPRKTYPLSDDSSAVMLDIDAALGSLDAPSTRPAFEDVVGSCAIGAKRRMHSSGVTGGFAGPGMHYHRRAESAPELDAIDRSRFGFPRLGSNPAMAIEEEEEDIDEEDILGGAVQKNLGINIVESASTHDEPIQRRRRRGDSADTRSHKPQQEHVPEEFGAVEIVGADEEPRFSVITKSSDESTITPTLSNDPLETRPSSAPFDFAISAPALTYGTPETPSEVSSPDFNRTSFEVPRIHTANSSITDRTTLNSTRTGDGLGLHSSVDDVPSLTSSASTMSARQPRFSSSANTFASADRSSSLSAAVPARTRPVSAGKRASLASLTRLVGGSYNRSKLNIETSAPTDLDEPTEKKKGHRISRLMKFWKSKEKYSS